MAIAPSGPPYPHGQLPGSNAIGLFTIGVSPIGPIFAFDYWATVISQYANSTVLTALIGNFFQYIDQTQNLDDFFDLIWNLTTAQGYGLDCWGNIVGVSRVVTVSNQKFLGFEEAGGGAIEPWNTAPFYSGATSTSNFALSDTAFRSLIYAKALSNITDCSIPAINQILLALFPGRGNCYVTDGEDMTMTYTFTFGLSPVELAVIQQSGAIPKPVGVAATVMQI